jgi:hypothetical protein
VRGADALDVFVQVLAHRKGRVALHVRRALDAVRQRIHVLRARGANQSRESILVDPHLALVTVQGDGGGARSGGGFVAGFGQDDLGPAAVDHGLSVRGRKRRHDPVRRQPLRVGAEQDSMTVAPHDIRTGGRCGDRSELALLRAAVHRRSCHSEMCLIHSLPRTSWSRPVRSAASFSAANDAGSTLAARGRKGFAYDGNCGWAREHKTTKAAHDGQTPGPARAPGRAQPSGETGRKAPRPVSV